MKKETVEDYKYKLMLELSRHIGKPNAISMVKLYKAVYGKEPKDHISGTRQLRKLITELRREGAAICSTTEKDGGGYYLASAGSELEEYCKRLRKRALKALSIEAKLRKVTLPELVGQIKLNLEGINGRI